MLSNKYRSTLTLGLLMLAISLLFVIPASAQTVVASGSAQGVDGQIALDGNTATATITNNNQTAVQVGVASYYKYQSGVTNSLPNQELFDYEVVEVAPGGQVTLTIQIPDCSTQIDIFVGDVIFSFSGENTVYGDRLVVAYHRNTFNCDPGGADEGCTPGYWRNHDGYWSQKAQPYVNIFFGDNGFLGGGDAYLLTEVSALLTENDHNYAINDALTIRGNRNRYEALMRASSAAILSATHPEVDYPLDGAGVIALVREAWYLLLDGNRDGAEAIKDQLDGYNNLGCDLGRFAYP